MTTFEKVCQDEKPDIVVLETFKKLEQGLQKEGKIPELWDGKASARIVDVLANAKEACDDAEN
jgi:hypothetical protein